VRRIEDLIGRTDYLEILPGETARQRKLDLTPLLSREGLAADSPQFCVAPSNAPFDKGELAEKMVTDMRAAIAGGSGGEWHYEVQNFNRSIGARLSGEIARRWGNYGMQDRPIAVRLTGNVGQSFGAWNAGGLHLYLEGDANDYVGKGLSGGRIIVYPPKTATFCPEENIIIGNVALYGAIHGEAYFRGQAAERFCVRNSGAIAVVEGVGDHGCEYMTGGVAVILGTTGRNFAAGMSGGVAYVYDPGDELLANCNMEMVELEPITEPRDVEELQRLIDNHREYTGSTLAGRLLSDWENSLTKFKKVIPTDYKRALQELADRSIATDEPGAADDSERAAAVAASPGGRT
jgi:glutamate synthase (NADPH) large chain